MMREHRWVGLNAFFAGMTAMAALAGLVVVLNTSPAHAQVALGGDKPKTPLQMQADEEEKRRQANDRAYQATMRRGGGAGDPAPVSDPWATVRPQPQKK